MLFITMLKLYSHIAQDCMSLYFLFYLVLSWRKHKKAVPFPMHGLMLKIRIEREKRTCLYILL